VGKHEVRVIGSVSVRELRLERHCRAATVPIPRSCAARVTSFRVAER
jgi:hypothetical protein